MVFEMTGLEEDNRDTGKLLEGAVLQPVFMDIQNK